MGGPPLDTATFRFEALAGHKYEISSQKCYQCFRLRDATTNELVAESPAEPESALLPIERWAADRRKQTLEADQIRQSE